MDQGTEQVKTFMCPICNELEPCVISPTETRRIVLSDSTLYGVWGKKMPKNATHFDIDSIVGGQMRDMTRALVKNYLHMPNRMEIIVVAGINNIGRRHSPDNVMEDVEELRQVVKEHSEKWAHSPPSYVAVCTLPLAPNTAPFTFLLTPQSQKLPCGSLPHGLTTSTRSWPRSTRCC